MLRGTASQRAAPVSSPAGTLLPVSGCTAFTAQPHRSAPHPHVSPGQGTTVSSSSGWPWGGQELHGQCGKRSSAASPVRALKTLRGVTNAQRGHSGAWPQNQGARRGHSLHWIHQNSRRRRWAGRTCVQQSWAFREPERRHLSESHLSLSADRCV